MRFPLRHFFQDSVDTREHTGIIGLLWLRLSMLGLSAGALLLWHHGIAPHRQWPLSAALLAGTALWTFISLRLRGWRQARHALTREIIIDFIWVGALVLVSGGSSNPFIYYYLVLVALAAVLLSQRVAWLMCGVGIALYSALLMLDLRGHVMHYPTEFRIHLIGMWLNFVGSAVILCFFVSGLISLLREQQAKITRSREENLKNEQLIGLATVAASTVHNLATPLGTLSVLIDDIIAQPGHTEALRQDMELMHTQLERCRGIMKNLAGLAENVDQNLSTPVQHLIAELQTHYALHSPQRIPLLLNDTDVSAAVTCNPLLEFALINLINNALDSSQHLPTVRFLARDRQLLIHIDNQCEIHEGVPIHRWGKPTPSHKDSGLGIGSFLANSTIEKQGGKVRVSTEEGDREGEIRVRVTVQFPLAQASN